MMAKGRDQQALGDLGESWFEYVASMAGFTVNRVARDRHGWDFLLELPPDGPRDAKSRLLDCRPGGMACLFQVKAIRDAKASIPVKLSNWESLAKKPLPAFFIVPVFDKGDEPSTAFLVHVDEALIAEILKRLRQVGEADHDKIHRKTLNLKRPPETRLDSLSGADLLRAVEEAVGHDPAGYALSIRTANRVLPRTGWAV